MKFIFSLLADLPLSNDKNLIKIYFLISEKKFKVMSVTMNNSYTI